MLMGVHAPLKEGDSFAITLIFENAGDVELRAAVMSATAMRGSDAHAEHGRAEQPSNEMATAMESSCHLPIQISEAVEQQPGGALYAGAAVQQHSHQGMPMPEMEGAHMVHRPQHGGAFFMAPNKLHHLEALYSDHCGFRVVFYNAVTQHIRANRFQAFVRAIPKDEDEPETLRFLSHSEDGATLGTTFGASLSKPFDVELYVKFPDSEEPQLFNIQVAGES